MKVWVLSTCIPDENEPCMPQVFLSEEAAEAAFAEAMRGEWDAKGGHDEPYPDDPHVAHDIMAETPEWGRWEVTSHHVDVPMEVAMAEARKFRLTEPCASSVPLPKAGVTTFIPENEHGVKPGYYTKPDIVRLLRKHHTRPQAVHFIADMME